jgi:hypothetical protein
LRRYIWFQNGSIMRSKLSFNFHNLYLKRGAYLKATTFKSASVSVQMFFRLIALSSASLYSIQSFVCISFSVRHFEFVTLYRKVSRYIQWANLFLSSYLTCFDNHCDYFFRAHYVLNSLIWGYYDSKNKGELLGV